MTEYRKPVGPKIGQGATALYDAEETLRKAFEKACTELGRVLGLTDHYHEILPEALFSFIENYDSKATKLAVELWLERHHVTEPLATGKTLTRSSGESVPIKEIRVPDCYHAAERAEKNANIVEALRRGFDRDIERDEPGFDLVNVLEDETVYDKLIKRMTDDDEGAEFEWGKKDREVLLETWHLAHDMKDHIQGNKKTVSADKGDKNPSVAVKGDKKKDMRPSKEKKTRGLSGETLQRAREALHFKKAEQEGVKKGWTKKDETAIDEIDRTLDRSVKKKKKTPRSKK